MLSLHFTSFLAVGKFLQNIISKLIVILLIWVTTEIISGFNAGAKTLQNCRNKIIFSVPSTNKVTVGNTCVNETWIYECVLFSLVDLPGCHSDVVIGAIVLLYLNRSRVGLAGCSNFS